MWWYSRGNSGLWESYQQIHWSCFVPLPGSIFKRTSRLYLIQECWHFSDSMILWINNGDSGLLSVWRCALGPHGRVFEKNLPLFQNFWKTNLEFNTSFVCWDSCRKRLAELTPLLKGRLGTEMLRRLDAALLASFHLGAQAVHSCKPLRRAAGGRKPAKFSSGNSYKVEP